VPKPRPRFKRFVARLLRGGQPVCETRGSRWWYAPRGYRPSWGGLLRLPAGHQVGPGEYELELDPGRAVRVEARYLHVNPDGSCFLVFAGLGDPP
jgi:hypothetical protein